MEMKYFRKLAGSLCYLSPICIDDAHTYTEWLNDLEITRFLTLAAMSINEHSERQALERLASEHAYAIIDAARDTLIGNCGVQNWDRVHQTAELGIFIGDREYLGRGYGTEAMQLLSRYAFDFLNIRSLLLRVHSDNPRAIASYRKVGFREVGTWHSSIGRGAERCDTIFMELLPEWSDALK